MDSKVFKQMLSPFGLIIGGSIATFCLFVFEQIEKMGILYLSGHQKVILFIGVTLSIWFMLYLKNLYDYKVKGRTDFGKMIIQYQWISVRQCILMYHLVIYQKSQMILL